MPRLSLTQRYGGSVFTATINRGWPGRLSVKTLYIGAGIPREDGCTESFNRKPRDGLLNTELFDTLPEHGVLADQFRWECNTIRPHSALGHRQADRGAILPFRQASA